MSDGPETCWSLLSVLCYSLQRQKQVIQAWFIENPDYIATNKISEIDIFLSAILAYLDVFINEFDMAYEYHTKLIQVCGRIESADYLNTWDCLVSRDWEDLCKISYALLNRANLDIDYSVSYIDYPSHIEIWTDDNKNIIGTNG